MNANDANALNPAARAIAGLAGALLIATVFLPWADVQGSSTTGWDLASATCVLAIMTGVMAIAAAITGGRIGFFRPDLSLNGAADLLGIASTLLVLWFVLFDLPEGASLSWGALVALAVAFTIPCACGDYRPLKGAPSFPSLKGD